jgi:hypothetical protein
MDKAREERPPDRPVDEFRTHQIEHISVLVPTNARFQATRASTRAQIMR